MAFVKAALNYAVAYSQALAQAYPYALYFGKLYNVENDSRYRWVNADTIKIPVLSVKGRVNGDRDSIGTAARNYNNTWETKQLTNFRKWSTLVHPLDIDETNAVASIQNITKVFNEEQKFREKDCYLISKLYKDWTDQSKTANTTAITAANILTVIDKMMEDMTEKRVPTQGRILYLTPAMNTYLKSALQRRLTATDDVVRRQIEVLDDVEIVEVPSDCMKTSYTFTEGCEVAAKAGQINLFLVHPSAVITPEQYSYAGLSEPSAYTEAKYYYYEESYEDVFILNKKADGLAFNITAGA
nr:MAG TPA: major capsid protein [Caudoviricetes sp.]